MVTIRNTVSRSLIGELNLTSDEVISGNEEEISHISVTTSINLLRTPTNNQKVKFEKYTRKICTFLNLRLNVAQSKKDTSRIVATREAVVTSFKILLGADNTVMLAKYTAAFEQGEEEATKKTIDLPTTIGGLKR